MLFPRKKRGSAGLPQHKKEYAGGYACSAPDPIREERWGGPLLRKGEA